MNPDGGGLGSRLTGSGLYLVITAPNVPHIELARAAVERGVPVIQLREKELPDPELLELARALRNLTDGTGTRFIVNDRPDIAAAVRADGVHIGMRDTDAAVARRIVGPDAIVGLSVNTVADAMAVEADVDYFGVGPVFPTDTKPDADDPVGADRITSITRAVPGIPVVAIGGLKPGNVATVVAAGARFAAVVSAVCFADDPVAAIDIVQNALATSADRSGQG
jgi:thiamine-phosphate pyrophosphorylase